ncbi:DUF3576 domain-containing protein [Sneathiella sp. DP05]|uniref:DUF3576 domain-containing protein n=2 Tax=Sneathiella litorea TaxID=2606216 RepID=A0A6L8W3Y4_9PROT|nr:DUF3576 domain-containing protein [Sneathiella litorea]
MGCLLAFVLAGCESDMSANSTFPTSSRGQVYQTGNVPDDTIFGKGGIFGDDEKELQDGIGSGGGLGVNAYLWRASLDTIAFMPLSSADPFGGVIITDWYSSPDSPNERFKVTVYILDRRLRADGVRVTAFKQNLDTSNQWIAIPLAPKVTADLENAILAKARDLRVAREGE